MDRREIDISKYAVEEWARFCSDMGQVRPAQLLRALVAKVERLEGEAAGWCLDAKTSASACDAQKLRAECAEELVNKYKWQIRDTCARAQLAEQRLAAAVEALNPFAKFHDVYLNSEWRKMPSDGYVIIEEGEDDPRARITVGDLRRAAAILQLQEPTHDMG